MTKANNMTNKNRVVAFAALLVVGIVIVGLGVLGYTNDLMAGCGAVLAAVSGIQLYRWVRYENDPSYAQMMDAANTDERLAFLASKAAEVTFQLSVYGLAILSFALRPFGYAQTANVLGVVMGVELTVYWVSYFILSRRY